MAPRRGAEGWVERSETHHRAATPDDGLRKSSTHPTRLTAVPAGDSRGRFEGQGERREFQPPRQLMTHSVTLRPLITILRKVYSITSSARTRNDSGIVKSSAFAVLRLITSWNLVGCSTGRSAGRAPFKMRST